MQAWLQRWLGIADLQLRLVKLKQEVYNLQAKQEMTHNEIIIHNNAIGRMINKLDPTFIQSYDDPARREESDRIGAKAISLIKAESLARQHTEGKL